MKRITKKFSDKHIILGLQPRYFQECGPFSFLNDLVQLLVASWTNVCVRRDWRYCLDVDGTELIRCGRFCVRIVH